MEILQRAAEIGALRRQGLSIQDIMAQGRASRRTVYRLLRIDTLNPAAKTLLRGRRWSTTDVLERLATLPPERQVVEAQRLADWGPTGGEALAMLGALEPSFDRRRRLAVLDAVLDLSRCAGLSSKAQDVVAVLVDDPAMSIPDLKQTWGEVRNGSANAVGDAIRFIDRLPDSLRVRVTLPMPPDLVSWLRDEMRQRWPDLDISEEQLRRLVRFADFNRNYLCWAMDIAEMPVRPEYEFREPVDAMTAVLLGMGRTMVKAQATWARRGGHPSKRSWGQSTWRPWGRSS